MRLCLALRYVCTTSHEWSRVLTLLAVAHRLSGCSCPSQTRKRMTLLSTRPPEARTPLVRARSPSQRRSLSRRRVRMPVPSRRTPSRLRRTRRYVPISVPYWMHQPMGQAEDGSLTDAEGETVSAKEVNESMQQSFVSTSRAPSVPTTLTEDYTLERRLTRGCSSL